MPRIQLCDEETGALMRGSAGPEARRALMHRPSMAHAIGMWNEAADDSELPLRLHELVRYRIALFNNCTRCQTYRRPNGDAVGVTDDLLGSVESWRTDARYDELERSALDFTERFIYDHGSIDDELLEKLRSGLGDGGIVDLAACVAKYMAVGRLIAVLDLDQDVSSGVMIVSSSTT